MVNVNAPVKFLEFLKDEGVNRSELFTKVAASYYRKEICNVCYSKLELTAVGAYCQPCGTRYWEKTNPPKRSGSPLTTVLTVKNLIHMKIYSHKLSRV